MLTNLIFSDPKLLKGARRVTLEEDRVGVVLGPPVPRHVGREEQAVADVTPGLLVILDLDLGRGHVFLDFNLKLLNSLVFCVG